MKWLTRLYRKACADNFKGASEVCFNVESACFLAEEEIYQLRKILATGFIIQTVQKETFFPNERMIEVGPRLNVATAWSTNMVSICQASGLDMITRVECSRRYIVPEGQDEAVFIAFHHDRMTECHYPEPLNTFDTGILPEGVCEVDLIGGGPDALLNIPGISMDERDRQMYYDYFVGKKKRNPSIVEIMDLNNANSEHSRHGFFKGRQIINGEEMPGTLFDLVTETLKANPAGSVVAFSDNSSVIEGHRIATLMPTMPGFPSPLEFGMAKYHPLLTAETHNFPTGVAPFPGAETGTGGRIRDVQATGRGGFVIVGTAGYCVGNLFIPGYDLPWENEYPCPDNLASALEIEIQASNGASDYGNKFGEPLIGGFTRSFDLALSSGERWGFLKPIMFTGGVGQIDARLTEKMLAEKWMLIVQVGGPAYRVGFGGGAASSKMQGEQDAGLDFNAVQRGDAEMEQKMNRVIRACNEMGDRTLIEVIHDQGAGGPANVLKELVEKSGGWIEIRNIRVGDPTMSVLEIYVAEYQERNGFLIRPENIDQFQAICAREKVGCEVLGEVTGDLKFVVHDSQDGTTPVEIDLPALLGDIPQKEFRDFSKDQDLDRLVLPEGLTVEQALSRVLTLPSVGSKRFLTSKVDRSVTGLVAQQQCCGPLQLTVADCAIVAQSHFGLTGIATSIGEQSIKMLVDPAAGARMAVAEALTNLAGTGGIKLSEVKCSANWMWAPKLPGEGVAIYAAAKAMRDVMIKIGIAVDGGKDSLSMATKVGGDIVKSPRQLVISTYAAIPDITDVVTPDFKRPGNSSIIFIDLSHGKKRLGGSALAQCYEQLGNECPDLEDPDLLKRAFSAIQELIGKDLVLAIHDVSDGGLIVALLEMAFAGNCGFKVHITCDETAIMGELFAEEVGMIIEIGAADSEAVLAFLDGQNVPYRPLGITTLEKEIILVRNAPTPEGGKLEIILQMDMVTLRRWWEETSHRIERLQMSPECAKEEKANIFDRTGPEYVVPFSIKAPEALLLTRTNKPRVAILREEGSNSDREMTSAFFLAGFEPWDVTMTDLLSGRITLDGFRGLAAVGGFSYADVPESAKGWAATILFNPALKEMFWNFYNRPDTFTLGVCNGCQLFGLLGWVPWMEIDPENQPRFVHNISGRFESRWTTVKVEKSEAMMFQGMEGLVFGIHVAHGEGRIIFPYPPIRQAVMEEGLIPMFYVDDKGKPTEKYPFNPNGSVDGIAGLCSEDGRHLAIMPHPERAFLPWQAHYLPEGMKRDLQRIGVSPWIQMFQNAYNWCIKS